MLLAAAAADDAGGVAIYWPAGSTGQKAAGQPSSSSASVAQPFEWEHAQPTHGQLHSMQACSDQHPQLCTQLSTHYSPRAEVEITRLMPTPSSTTICGNRMAGTGWHVIQSA